MARPWDQEDTFCGKGVAGAIQLRALGCADYAGLSRWPTNAVRGRQKRVNTGEVATGQQGQRWGTQPQAQERQSPRELEEGGRTLAWSLRGAQPCWHSDLGLWSQEP